MDIDFDEASAAWRANKRHLGNGMFAYMCAYVHSNGKLCRNIVEAQQQKPLYRTTHPEWTVLASGPVKGRDPMRWCRRHRRYGNNSD
jgi:hypothetical protein